MPNFEQYKDDQAVWYSPPRYTHPGGYRFGIAVRADDCTEEKQIAVYFYSMMGSCDRVLRWPVSFTITLQLLNQEGDQDHINVTKSFSLSKIDAHKGYVIAVPQHGNVYECILHDNLQYDAEKNTCFLKNNCLLFRVAEVKLN